MAKQEFLIRAYFDDFIKNNVVTEEETQAEYEKVKAEQSGTGERKEYKARHILMKDEKAAKAVLAQLNKAKGKNFAALAKAKSEDTGSKNDGGALDWSDGSNYVPEFAAALTKLQKGEWTLAGQDQLRLPHHHARGHPRDAVPALRPGQGAHQAADDESGATRRSKRSGRGEGRVI